MTVDDTAMIATSFPGFRALMQGLGARASRRRGRGAMIIAIDGPAASGKGTLAKRRSRSTTASPCLDTGLLYRAVARDVLRARRRASTTPRRRRRGARRSIRATLDDPAPAQPRQRGEAASIVAAHPRGARRAARVQRALRRAAAAARCSTAATSARSSAPTPTSSSSSPPAAEVRAQRRSRELPGQGEAATYEARSGRHQAPRRPRAGRDERAHAACAGRATCSIPPNWI